MDATPSLLKRPPMDQTGARSDFSAGFPKFRLHFVAFLLLSGLFVFPFSVSAQDDAPWAKMLEGFKDPSRGYYDTALEYLEWMKTSPLCPDSLKGQMDYQIAMVHLEAIETGSIFLSRDDHMKNCRDSLEKYIKEHPDGDLAFDARSTLGRLFMEEGRLAIMKSEHELTRDNEREPLRLRAREEFKKSIPYFESADKWATEQARKLQAAQKENPNAVKEADLYAAYGRFLAGKILINLAKMDLAKTYPNNSKEFKDGLTTVAKDFQDLARKYANYTAGFEAKLYAAKTYKDLGDFKTARALLGELNTLQGDEFLKIRTESLLLALEMNLADKKPENYLDSINRAKGWNETVPATAKISRDGQRIFLLGAKNFIAYADTVKENKADYDRAMRDAGVFLRQIRPTYPQIAREAQELLRSIGAVRVNKEDPENFEQAKEFAEDDWKDFVIAFSEYQEAKDDTREAAKTRLMELGEACLKSFNRAINMREAETPMAEVNALRLNLVRVYWFQGQILEAALLADYLAQRYSGVPDADKTAVMAVRLYRQMFVEDKQAGHDVSAVAYKLDRLCDFILKRWEGQEVTGEVQLLQIETAIDNGDIEEARKLLAQTMEGTPQRVSAELKIGQSLWNRYASLSRLPEGAEGKPTKKELDALLADAKKQLTVGLEGKSKLIKDGKIKVDATSIQCALALGQICVNAGESDDAIKWLNDPSVGPLYLVANPPGTVSVELLKGMQLGATMLVLRAYVATENLDKAEETMNQLEAAIREQDADEQKLTQIYVSLGRQLENRLKELGEAGELDQAEKVAQGFELFLKRIKDRDKANSFQSIYWVADTFYRLGSGMKSVPDQAAKYYREAGGTYVGILKRVDEEPEWAPERAADTIKARLAESLRCVAPYRETKEQKLLTFEMAMEYITQLLGESEGRIDLQIEAALTLEAWGKDDPKKLMQAVAGINASIRDDVKYGPVWGWNGLIKRTSQNVDRFAEFYYDAYLSKFRCVLEIARGEKDRKKKENYLNNLERDMTGLVMMRPQLGGPEWFAQFDQVYKSLERAKGSNRPGGLKELLEKIGEEVPTVEGAANASPTVSDDPDAPRSESVSSLKEELVKKSDSSDSLAVWAGLGTVVLCIPVILFFALRKKKR